MLLLVLKKINITAVAHRPIVSMYHFAFMKIDYFLLTNWVGVQVFSTKTHFRPYSSYFFVVIHSWWNRIKRCQVNRQNILSFLSQFNWSVLLPFTNCSAYRKETFWFIKTDNREIQQTTSPTNVFFFYLIFIDMERFCEKKKRKGEKINVWSFKHCGKHYPLIIAEQHGQISILRRTPNHAFKNIF